MTAQPLVSVLMPVFNGEQHLEEAVRSVLDGDFRDLELVCINDGSTDGSLAILQAIAREDDRLRIFSQENGGIVAATNQAVAQARGRYFARLDHDDIAVPQRLSRQLAHLEATGADIVVSSYDYCGTRVGIEFQRWAQHGDIAATMLLRNPIGHSTVFCRAEVMREHRYDPAYELAEDFDLWTRLVWAGKTFAGMPEVLLHYRWHEAQASQRHMSRQTMLADAIVVRMRAWFGVSPAIFGGEGNVVAYSAGVMALAGSLIRHGIFPTHHGWRETLSGTGCVSDWPGRLLRRAAIELAWLRIALHRAAGCVPGSRRVSDLSTA